MQAERETGVVWLESRHTVSHCELAAMCGMDAAEIDELVEYGLLKPLAESASGYLFSAGCVPALREAGMMRARFDFDLFVAGLLYSQRQRIAELEAEVRALRAHLPHWSAS
jgi:hypothetical protein